MWTTTNSENPGYFWTLQPKGHSDQWLLWVSFLFSFGPSSFPAVWTSQLTWAFFPWTWHRYFSIAGPDSAWPAGWSHTRRRWHTRHSHAAGPHTGWGRKPHPCCASLCLSEGPVGNETRSIAILVNTWEKLTDKWLGPMFTNISFPSMHETSTSFIKYGKLKSMSKWI